MAAVSTMRITVFLGARGRCMTSLEIVYPLQGIERDGLVFQLDDKLAFEDEEEFVFVKGSGKIANLSEFLGTELRKNRVSPPRRAE
jgi:hypothetical protein